LGFDAVRTGEPLKGWTHSSKHIAAWLRDLVRRRLLLDPT
jgi:hypothetical protein